MRGLTRPLTLVLHEGRSEIDVRASRNLVDWYPDTPLMKVTLVPMSGDNNMSPTVTINSSLAPVYPSQPTTQVEVTILIVVDRPHYESEECSEYYDEYELLGLGRVSRSSEAEQAYQRLELAFISLDPSVAREWIESSETRELLIV